MDPEEMQAIIAELEQQRSVMGARAAEYARANYRLQKENTELKRQLEEKNEQAINGEDRETPPPFVQRYNT